MDYRLAISSGWTVIWALILGLTLPFTDHHRLHLRLRLLVAAISLIWAGMVLGISFLEAWVKFGAGLATRTVGVDIGGRVFRALNSAELVHCAVLDFVYVMLRLKGVRIWADWVLMVLTAFVMCQVVWLTPKLVQNAAWCAANADEGEIPACKALHKEKMKALMGGHDGRWPNLHRLYVLMEVVKIGLLMGLSASSVSIFAQ